MDYNITVTANAEQTAEIEKLDVTYFEATLSSSWYEIELECSNKQLMPVIVLMERLKLNKCKSYKLTHINNEER